MLGLLGPEAAVEGHSLRRGELGERLAFLHLQLVRRRTNTPITLPRRTVRITEVPVGSGRLLLRLRLVVS